VPALCCWPVCRCAGQGTSLLLIITKQPGWPSKPWATGRRPACRGAALLAGGRSAPGWASGWPPGCQLTASCGAFRAHADRLRPLLSAWRLFAARRQRPKRAAPIASVLLPYPLRSIAMSTRTFEFRCAAATVLPDPCSGIELLVEFHG